MTPNLTKLVATLPSTVPFVGPEAQERARGRAFRARIGANENVFGPSPKAVAAMAAAAADCWMYCDPENHDVKVALAKHLGVKPENIAVGEGIDSLFGYTVRLFVDPAGGDTVVTSAGAYPTFNFHVAGYGGRLVTVPYAADREDPEHLLDAARREKPKLIYFANPDNPMGSWWNAGGVQQFIERVPEGTVLVLDEAYAEFAPDGTMPPLDVSDPRVLRFRTFSKAYGMAGARIAYVIGEASLIKCFDKIRNHFSVNRIAQAGALAALADQEHLRRTITAVSEARSSIGGIAERCGFRPLPSATNFVTIDCGRDGAYAKSILDGLIARDVFVRMPGVAPLNRCIRISAGKPADLDILEEALTGVVKATG
ncbi:MAG TPA: pyridoxal phosphate-dependent aminotransferase [Hyphomicrobiaceae bacterium]|nr:pyridoxal phosphate-dependent aminotransferase [Hyphomicrobiaceae bacterium]